jgi:hypothetical protein
VPSGWIRAAPRPPRDVRVRCSPGASRAEGAASPRRVRDGDTGGARPSPRHQTTVEPLAPSDRPSGPKTRNRGVLPPALTRTGNICSTTRGRAVNT